MALQDMLIPTYVQMLQALSVWLAKAQKRLSDGEAEALLAARLADDMFPLSTQIRFACVQAYEGVYRLKGEPLPPVVEALLNEGRGGGDKPGSLADARQRIAETIAVVESLASGAFDANLDRIIEHSLPDGMIFDLTAQQYVRDWAIPQFYFHLMAAYSILRSEGVALGKIDYVSHMLAYVRPGSMPAV